MAEITPEEWQKLMASVAPELRGTVSKIEAELKRASKSTSDFSRSFTASSSSLGGAVGSLVNYVKRVNTEAMDPFMVGFEGLSTALSIGEKGLSSLGGDLAKLGNVFGKGIGQVGGAIAKLGGGLVELAGKGVGVAQEAFEFFAQSLIQTQGVFKEITRAGIVLGSGMTGIGDLSTQAGVPIRALSKGLSLARQDLSSFGTGAGQATQKVAGVMGELTSNGGELYQQLSALGYSTEEQVALVAQQMAQDKAAGITQARDNKAISMEAVELGKNMKILSDVTGKDAKQAMEQARIKSMEADLLAKAEAEGGAEGRKKLAAQLAAMPEEVKKGYLEFVSTGGQAVADVATNVAMQNNPKLREYYESMFNMLSDTGVKSTEASRLSLKGLEDVAAFARENVNSSASIASAARLTGDALLGGATTINNALIMMSTKLEKGTTDAVAAEADRLKKRDDPLLKFSESITAAGLAIQTDVQTMLRKPNEAVAEAMDKFTGTLKDGVKSLKTFIEDLTKEFNKQEQNPPRRQLPGPDPAPTPAAEPPKRQLPGPAPAEEVPRRPIGGAREKGGAVTPGNRYLVGEKGPEYIMPKSMSTVLPNEILKSFKDFSQTNESIDRVLQSNSALAKEFESAYKSLSNAGGARPDNQSFQSEMLSVLREQIVLMRNNLNISSQMLESMDDIYSVQTRIADSRA